MKWTDIIGQEKAKQRFDFHFEAAKNGEPLPNFMLCSAKGFGKTTIGESFGLRVQTEINREKRMLTINASAIKNLKQFWNSIVGPVIKDRDVTLLIDEASELPQDVTMFMLSMINPNENHWNSVTYDDMTVDIDMRRQSFMFSTTEPHKVFHALMDRCRRIDLEDYTYAELAKIIQRNAKTIQFKDNSLELVSPTLRGSPRRSVSVAHDIKTYLAPLKRSSFTAEDWAKLSSKLDFLPLGVSRGELQVMRILAQTHDCTLNRLAASLGKSPASVQRDVELYLQKLGFMDISTTGRNLTMAGHEYLKQLDGKVKK